MLRGLDTLIRIHLSEETDVLGVHQFLSFVLAPRQPAHLMKTATSLSRGALYFDHLLFLLDWILGQISIA